MLLGLLGAAGPVEVAAAPAPRAAAPSPPDNEDHLYVLDAYGGVNAVGSAPALPGAPSWPGWDIARGLGLFGDASGGYVLDAFGGLHPVGASPTVTGGAYWSGWDIARGLALLPDASASQPAGYVLDGWGGLHPFGGAPAVSVTAYWSGWDIARGVALLPGGDASHPAGYVVDGWGSLHPFGGAPALDPGAYWPGWDIARGLTLWTAAPAGSPGGWTLDGWGGVHAFGSAPARTAGAYWRNSDLARGLSGGSASSGARSVVTGGVIQNVRYSRQAYALSCEATSLEMALSHEGIFTSQGRLLAAMTVDPRSGYYDYNGLLHWGDPYVSFVGDLNGSEDGLTGYGAYANPVVRAAESTGGIVLLAGTSIGPQLLYSEVLAGHPAVAWVSADWRAHAQRRWAAFDRRWIPWAGPLEHAVAVVGVSPTEVYVYNPIGGIGWVPRSTFEAAYSSYGDMAVIVS